MDSPDEEEFEDEKEFVIEDLRCVLTVGGFGGVFSCSLLSYKALISLTLTSARTAAEMLGLSDQLSMEDRLFTPKLSIVLLTIGVLNSSGEKWEIGMASSESWSEEYKLGQSMQLRQVEELLEFVIADFHSL